MRHSISILIVITILSIASVAFAGTYWVDNNGAATWANCQGASPLSGTSACSLATANANADAGDIVNLRGGTYNISINPSNSGTSGNKITYQAYNSEAVIISGTFDIITFNNVDYIVVDGIEGRNPISSFITIANYANYNEIKNSTIYDDDGVTIRKGVKIWGACRGGSAYTCYSTNNWIHNNTFYGNGSIDPVDCNDLGGLMYIGTVAETVPGSNYNVIENNLLYWGGHHIIEIETQYNVFRNNVLHNEGWMTNIGNPPCLLCADDSNKYGNRNILFYNGGNNLIENNRFGHAGLPSDGNGGDNVTLGSDSNIMRYNTLFNSMEVGLYFRTSGTTSFDNRVYNNTIYRSGQAPVCRDGPGVVRYGVRFQNRSDGNIFINNIVTNSVGKDLKEDAGSNNTLINNWITSTGDPEFVNTDVSDPMSTTLPDLSLQSGSGAVNRGTHLTQANGSGVNSTTLIVDDALYFQDGTWGSSLSNIQADWIAIGTVSNRVQISSIDYSTNTITLKSPVTWSDNANIWLYKDSAGRIVLWGSAPDIGAHEFNTSVPYLRIEK